MSLGFEQAGFDVVAALERDPAHAAAHRFNFPRCEVIEGDALTVSAADVRKAVRAGLMAHDRADEPQIDVLFGGPPCQGFSVGGRLDPDDLRNLMVRRFVELIEQLRPRAFVLENVPAMASGVLPRCAKPVPEWLCYRLMHRGSYVVPEHRVLNASRYGVPQDRRRLLIVGVLRGETVPELPAQRVAPQLKRPGMRPKPGELGHPKTPNGLATGPTVQEAIGDLPELHPGPYDDDRVDDLPELLERDWARLPDERLSVERSTRSAYASWLAGDEPDETDFSVKRKFDATVLTSSLRTVHTQATLDRFDATKAGDFEETSRFYRLHPRGLSGTLRAGTAPENGSFSAPRPIHPSVPRVITVREAARLSGFPDWFRFTAAKWHGFRQVGNAVPPPLAHAVACAIRDALGAPSIRVDDPIDLGDSALLLVASGSGRRSKKRRPQSAQPTAA